MLQQLLEQGAQFPGNRHWTFPVPGVHVCDFSCELPDGMPTKLEPEYFEILFCQSGILKIDWEEGRRIHVGEGDILLLSDATPIPSFHFPEGRLQGTLVAVDGPAARGSLVQLCALLGGVEWNLHQVFRLMKTNRGCVRIHGGAWSEAFFTNQAALPAGERGQYCTLKAVELLYLLHRGGFRLPEEPYDSDYYQDDTIRQIHSYICGHLAEDLSIRRLSEEFHISPTILKTYFRKNYGKPIHRYISDCRMQRAAELLTTTPLSVAQIASEVGYSSVGQFGAMFKQRYHLSPAQYRK